MILLNRVAKWFIVFKFLNTSLIDILHKIKDIYSHWQNVKIKEVYNMYSKTDLLKLAGSLAIACHLVLKSDVKLLSENMKRMETALIEYDNAIFNNLNDDKNLSWRSCKKRSRSI